MFVIGRCFYVQVLWGNDLRALAVDQWTRELPITAKRGEIVDCNGVKLAVNKSTYAIYVRPRCVTNAREVSRVLASIFGLNEESLYTKITTTKTSEITIKRQVQKDAVLQLENYSLDGVYYSVDNTREYPLSDSMCQILGYTSIDGTGVCGIEGYYNEYLKGINGEILYEADLTGKDVNDTFTVIPSTSGLSVKLSIDSEIQLLCETALDKVKAKYTPKSASIVVVEPSTGKIRALAQADRFNLNSPPRNDIELLNELSRCTVFSDSYEPGSTFKIVTALANIEEDINGNKKAFSQEYIFNSSGYRMVLGKKIKCWTSHIQGKHSNETLSDALNNSCNPCFVDIALSLGKETMYEYIEKLNFGSVTGVDFFGEASGMVLPVSMVTDGDIARISFGQTIAVTPIQLASAACACVNGGKYYAPSLIEEIYDEKSGVVQTINPQYKGRVASEKASKILANYLEKVVSEGSGKNAYIEGYKVGGKTGTAQKYENGVIAQGKNIMSFMGFFPADNPKYLALAIVDEPVGGTYGSTVSAPIVKEVFEGIIKIKNIQSN